MAQLSRVEDAVQVLSPDPVCRQSSSMFVIYCRRVARASESSSCLSPLPLHSRSAEIMDVRLSDSSSHGF